MALRFAVLAALLVPAASLTLIKATTEINQFGHATIGSALHPEQTARLLASVQDTWRSEAQRTDVESLTSFPKSCSTVASAALMGSSGDHDRVQEYMANVCKQSVLDMWHRTTCNKFKVSLGKSMIFNTFANRMNFNYGKFCAGFWKEFSAEEGVEQKAADKKLAEQKSAEAAKIKLVEEKEAEQHKAEEEAKAFMEQKEKEHTLKTKTASAAVKPNPLFEGAVQMEGALTKTAEQAQKHAENAHTHISNEAASVVDTLKMKKDLKEANAHSVALRKLKDEKAAEEAKVEAEKAEEAKKEALAKAEESKLAAEKAEQAETDAQLKAEEEVEKAEARAKEIAKVEAKKEQIKVLEAKLKIVLEKKRVRKLEEAKKAEAAKAAKEADEQKNADAAMALEQAEKAKRVAKAEADAKVEAEKAAVAAKELALKKLELKKNEDALAKAESKLAAEKAEKAADAEEEKKHQASKAEKDALVAKAREAAKLALLNKNEVHEEAAVEDPRGEDLPADNFPEKERADED